MTSENVEKIVTVIAQIPRGKVATYGQIAKLAGIPRNARQVGRVLRDLSAPFLPWHRVVNSKGEISRGNDASQQSSRSNRAECVSIQREALKEENVQFDERGRVRLDLHQWNPAI